MTVKVMGVEFPFAYTVEAELQIEEKFGGAMDKQKIKEIFDTTEFPVLRENVIFVAVTMIETGVKRENVRCRMMGQEQKKWPEITCDALKEALTPGEVVALMRKCLQAINFGNKVNVEVLPEKGSKKKDDTKSR